MIIQLLRLSAFDSGGRKGWVGKGNASGGKVMTGVTATFTAAAMQSVLGIYFVVLSG